MAPSTTKKRSYRDSNTKSRVGRPHKRQRKPQDVYHSNSEEEEEEQSTFKPVNLMESDDEGGLDAVVDDGASSDSAADSQSDSGSEDENSARQKLEKPKAIEPKTKKRKLAQDAPLSSGDDEQDDEEESDADSFDLDEDEDGDESTLGGGRNSKSKRNDPAAFATSLQKILGTKLSTSRRSDPVLSRSVDAHKASKEVVDAALEAKARKQMRAAKLAAQEKGRVKDVIIGSRNDATGELEISTGEIREKEKQLRRAATRGVKELFNAFLKAQQAGMDAEVQARKEGFTGVEGRKEKVTEMSRKGFLDLIATGGGKPKKGGIEEA
ncbi:putative Ribosomal RNA-processing protein 15 [Seiridium cardinale]|uniref:Ribosomal RNA-processing protein 15 n=1 Tax=Seiridium cardinale TaxID=138064 RepID=A0ABR2Y904_9PEZI